MMAVRATGDGDVTNTHRVWHVTGRQPQRIGSPIVVNGRLYCVNENGVAICIAPETGKELAKSQSRVCGQTWSSLVHADRKLYISNLSGETTVLNTDLSVVARNRLSDRIASSPAVSNGEIFIRGYDYLYCVGNGD